MRRGPGAAALAVMALLAGCLDSAAVMCDDGTVCPAQSVCDDVHGGCVTRDQLEECDGEEDETPCDLHGDPVGICAGGVCVREGCGDGFVRGAEQCDGADLAGKPDCMDHGYYEPGEVGCAACMFVLDACEGGICGDGIIQEDERCDGEDALGAAQDCQDLGFYDPGPISCDAQCRYDDLACTGWCGDGSVNGGELCDGAPPPQTCLDFGRDAGALDCLTGTCAPDLSTCRAIGWDLVPPVTTANLVDVTGTAADDVFAVGNDDILHHDGERWTVMDNPVPSSATSIWAAGAGDVWAATIDSLLHWDGTAWSCTSFENTEDKPCAVDPDLAEMQDPLVWGSGPDDVYVFAYFPGDDPRPLHFGGGLIETLSSMAGAGSTIWFVGGDDDPIALELVREPPW